MSDLFRRQSSTGSYSCHSINSTISTPAHPSTSTKSTDPKQQGIPPPRQIGLNSFLAWLKDHPSSSKVGSDNLARFLLVKSVSLMAAFLGCIYGLVFDLQLSISACSILLFFLPAFQGFTGATRLCGLILSLALATVFLSFQTRSMPLLGPSLETTLLFGLPLVTGMLVGRRVGLLTCIAVLCYSIEEYRSKTRETLLTEEEASRLWAGFGAYWVFLLFVGAMTCLYQWCVEVCVRDANLFKDIAVANAKSKDGVVSSVSHELRTPLAALIGWTELLMSDQTLSASAQSTVSMLHSSTLSLLTILNALLDVSKVSAAKMTNCSQNFNLHDLVLDTTRMMTGLSGTRTVELLVDFSAEVPELVRADPGIIKQVLGNLISNAIKFTDVGYVNVGVSLKDEDDDSVTVEFVVQDTGKGIADEQKDKLFVEFSQVEGGKCKTHEAGTGLGLFLVKNLVEVMNGTVFVTSKLGVGSTFGFVIKMEKQFLAFRTPGYDHVVTVSSAFQSAVECQRNPTSPILPVTPGLARSTPMPVNESLGVKMTPSTPAATPKDQNQAKDYFTLQTSEVTRANANNITLRTQDHAFLSNRQYYLHSQCNFFEDFLWKTASGRWKAHSVRKLTYDECTSGWQTDMSTEGSLARLGDVFLIDLSPTTNRPKCEAAITDQEHARQFLVKLSKLLIERAKARIGTAHQASIILFYPFGHPPSVTQDPLLTLSQYYQISLCRKPVSERALGTIIKRQVVTLQAGPSDDASPAPNAAPEASAPCTSGAQGSSQPQQATAKTTSCTSSPSSSATTATTNVTAPKEKPMSAPKPKVEIQTSNVTKPSNNGQLAKKNDSLLKVSLSGGLTSSSVVDRPTRSLLKRASSNIKSLTRPALRTSDSIQDLNASGKRVLIVDDNSFNRNLLYHQLSKLGVSNVDQAASGQEAVDTFRPGVHALVLMDLKMPLMGGFQATTLIREKELAHWGPTAVIPEPSKSSPIMEALNESWLDDNCPWSPERFAGPPEMSGVRRGSGGGPSIKTDSSESLNKDKDAVCPASIVAVTADWTAEIGEDRDKALNGGFDDVMVKPISLPSLSLLLDRYMEH
ncbi:hypothetical protein BGX34_004118 [Mortierella sp. NVP85]|nr:hypothetical protein BGX34_004118 [Mortierella sp. NVP85]